MMGDLASTASAKSSSRVKMLERMWGKGNTPPLLVGVQTGTALLDISMVISQKFRNNLPQDPAIPLLGICSKDALPYHKDMCSTMFIAALFIIVRTWKKLDAP